MKRVIRSLIPLLLICFTLSLAGMGWASSRAWEGPRSGPVGQVHKKITFISYEFKNGGISAVYRSFSTAAKVLGWQVDLLDGQSNPRLIRAALAGAIQAHQNGIVLGGFQIDQHYADLIAQARQAHIRLIGWHAAAEPGPSGELFTNIATSSTAVARMAADFVVRHSHGTAGVVIFNDSHFAVANAKTRYMKEAIERCKGCRLLTVEDIAIATADKDIPRVLPLLSSKYGKAWTYTLAINDVYFDAINVPLLQLGRKDIRNVSAGDGSYTALERIRSGISQQIATVAEPAGLQGWQLADELNRAFAGQPPSGYISKPILVTRELLMQVGSAGIDSNIPYRAAYTAIWHGVAP
jgi:ribose transport system substrate-binding protein